MLGGIADALEHGVDVRGDRPEVCDDGTLDWVWPPIAESSQ
ncbi:hypothetical protein [Actinomadura rudentiformis]|nr:hypothetical protein [Actinomadura rudentiformis]